MPTALDMENKSILTIANIHLVDDPSIQQFDTILVSMELFLRLFPLTNNETTNLTNDKFVLIKFLGAPDYFKEFKIFKINFIDHKSPGPNSIVFINDSNLNKFSNQITVTTALIQSINQDDIPIIDDLYVSVPNDIYLIMKDKSNDAIKHQFLDNYLVSNGRVVSNHDIIRPINGKVILCEPISQGKVTSSTNIYIIKHNTDLHTSSKTLVNDSIDNDGPVNDFDDDDSDINISNYLSSSLNLDDFDEVKYSEFNVRPLPNKMFMNNLPIVWSKEDTELFVFINTNDLKKFGHPVFNGDTVLLKYDNGEIYVKLFTVMEPNKSFDSGVIYISPILSTNLNFNADTKVHVGPVKDRGLQLSTLIPVAKSVTISRVASPITLDRTYQQHFFSALKTSFNSCLKTIKQNDLIPVAIDSVLSKTMFDIKDNEDELGVIPTGDPDSVAWFKINDIYGDESQTNQFIIDPLKTRMILSGVEFIRQPTNEFHNWYDYLNLPPLFPYNKSIQSNPVNFQYARTLKKILLTNINSKINLKTSVLLSSMSRGLGKTTVVKNLCLEMGINLIELDAVDYINPGSELKTIGLISGQIDKLICHDDNDDNNTSFNVIYLKHIENLCPDVNENEQGANIFTSLALKVMGMLNDYLNQYGNVVIVMSCNDIDKLHNSLRLMIKFQVEFNVPTESERLEIFKFLINKEFKKNLSTPIPEFNEDKEEFLTKFDMSSYPIGIRDDVSFESLALQSAGLTSRDLISILKKAKNLAFKRLSKLSKDKNLDKLIKIGSGGQIKLIPEDFNVAINDARNKYSDSIGAPRIPNVKWEDIGGLDVVKDEILDTIDLPLKHPELFSAGLKKRSGILFYGPPGTGKTLLAKAIATNFSLNFFSVKGPELLNMYIGESEANVRRVFQKARDAKPCVIFFDELDSVAPKRGNQGDSGGVMDRIVSQLLAELDGMSGGGENGGEGVFVVGATNRPDLLDEALLRPGRYDKMLYLGISDTNDKQIKILEALTRKFTLDDDVELDKIAEKCSFTFTGADFYALCSDAMLNAMTRIASEVDTKIKYYNQTVIDNGKEEVSTRWWFDNIATEEDTLVVVKMTDFVKAQRELVPSVSAEELQHYLRIRQNFEGGKTNNETADKSNDQVHVNGEIKDLLQESNGVIDENKLSEIIQNGNNVINQNNETSHS